MAVSTSRWLPGTLIFLSLVLFVVGVVCYFVTWLLWGDLSLFLALGCFAAGVIFSTPWAVLSAQWSCRPRERVALRSCAGIHLAATFGFWILPLASLMLKGPHRQDTSRNLHQITLAMHEYAEGNESRRFPPAALRDKEGKPLLSWRVLLLPHLGEGVLYREFRLDEPWDSPHNLALLDRMPRIYQTVYPDSTPAFTTRFQVFVGPGTPFEIAQGPHLTDDFPDGLSGTVLVAEAGEPVTWTKPVDLLYSPEEPLPRLGRAGQRCSRHLIRLERDFLFSCGDISTHRLHLDGVRSEQIIRQMIVRNDGKGWEDR